MLEQGNRLKRSPRDSESPKRSNLAAAVSNTGRSTGIACPRGSRRGSDCGSLGPLFAKLLQIWVGVDDALAGASNPADAPAR